MASAITGYQINSLDDAQEPISALAGAYFEVEMPLGPVAGGYVNLRLRGDRLRNFVQGALPGPNLRPDGFKSVRFLTSSHPLFDPNSDHALEELDTRLACLGTKCPVNFEPRPYVLVYDANPNRPGGPFANPQCWRDGHMAYPTPLVPCKWAPEDSASAQVKDYTEYPANYIFTTGTFIGAYVPGQSTEQFFKAIGPDGPRPAPTGQPSDPYWELKSGTDVPITAAPVALFRTISHAEALATDSDDQLRRGQEYLVTDRPGGGPAVRGTFSRFAPAGMQYATLEGQPGAFAYDLASDTDTDHLADLVDLKNEVGALETVVTQQGGWIGTLGNLLTSFKGNLVGAINEVLGKTNVNASNITANTTAITNLQAANGRFTIQNYAGDFSLVALTAGRVLQNSTATDIKCQVFGSGLNGLTIGTKYYLRRTGTGKLTITPAIGGDNVVPVVDFIGTTAEVPLNAMYLLLLLGANHWQVSIAEASGVAAASGGGTSGIDYANPITLTATATLQANKAYYATGTGYALTLPAASANLGAAIFVSIAANATGLFPLSIGGALYAAESIGLRATADGWKKTGGELLALSARLETTLQQQDQLQPGALVRVPFSVIAEQVAAVPALIDLANNAIVVPRAGRATIGATVALQDTQGAAAYFFLLRQVRGGTETTLYQTLVTTSSALAQGGFSYTGSFQAGDVLTLYLYNNDGQPTVRLRGQYAGSQATFTFLEIV